MSDRAPRRIDRPEAGYWLARLVRNGPFVPVAIIRFHTTAEPDNFVNVMDRSPFLVGFIAGKMVSPSEVWERRGRPITRAIYEYEVRDQQWARTYAPNEPKAQPEQRIDLRKLPPITPP